MLNATPAERLLDPQGRPYFLWDCAWTDVEFRELLASSDPQIQAILLGKLMRQAKPEDVFQYTTEANIRKHWPDILPYLGKTRPFWEWLFSSWDRLDGGADGK